MKKYFGFFVVVCWTFVGCSSGYDDAVWNDYRHPQSCMAPVPVMTSVGICQSYSLGDKDRFAKHQEDMMAFFRDDRILQTWGGINTRDDPDAKSIATIQRFRDRAENQLPSWRLTYDEADNLACLTAAYLNFYAGCVYDGGAEIAYCTHPGFWLKGVATGSLVAYLETELFPNSKFLYAWASVDPQNTASLAVLNKFGFGKWTDRNEADKNCPGRGRENRDYYKASREILESKVSLFKKI